MKFCWHALVPYSITGIVSTAFDCLIAYINSIFPSFGDVGLITYRALVIMMFCSLDDTCCSRLKGILIIDIVSLMESESGKWGLLPVLVIGMFCISCGYRVIVYYHLILLPVAFTRGEHHSSCFLQHRDEIRHYYCLSKEILAGTKQRNSLPSPFVLGNIVIYTMTRPYREVPVIQTTADRVGA